MATYVTICAGCLYEQYFLKQARANSAKVTHEHAHRGHAVRVTRVRTPACAMGTLAGRGHRRASAVAASRAAADRVASPGSRSVGTDPASRSSARRWHRSYGRSAGV
jgi:hypothetical protein